MEKILLVEDNEQIMDINSTFLASLGYTVKKAASVREAGSVLFSFSPDLIVLDVMLPDGDGMDLCSSIRKTRDTPILFLTAKVEKSDVVEGLERGGDDYLTKPYDLDVLASHIKALLRRKAQSLPEHHEFAIGPLSLNIVLAQAFVKGDSLNLSQKEFGILLCLAQHRGTSVDRKSLFKAVWGYEDTKDGAALWPIVSRLKKKIKPYETLFFINSDHSGYELVITNTGWDSA